MTTAPLHDSQVDAESKRLLAQGARIHGVKYVSNCNVTIHYSINPNPELNLEPYETKETKNQNSR